MIRKLFLTSFLILFGFPVKSQEQKDLFMMMDISLQCQAAASLTVNFYNIYLGFKHGIEKADINDIKAPAPILALKPMFDEYELLLVKIKKRIQAEQGVNANQIEFMRYAEHKQGVLDAIATEKISPEFIRNIMIVNQDCYKKLDERKSYFPD